MSGPSYLGTREGAMFAVLLGGKGAMEHRHARSAVFELQRVLAGDAPSVSCAVQKEAAAFYFVHGTRATRAYAKALRRRNR